MKATDSSTSYSLSKCESVFASAKLRILAMWEGKCSSALFELYSFLIPLVSQRYYRNHMIVLNKADDTGVIKISKCPNVLLLERCNTRASIHVHGGT